MLKAGWGVLLLLVFWRALSIPSGVQLLLYDKLGHFLVFAVLGFWALKAWETSSQHRFLLGFLAVYGLAIEIAQYFVPYRSFSVADWIADLLGIAFSVILFKLLK